MPYLSTKSEMRREQRRERQGKGDEDEEVLLFSRLHRSFCNSCTMFAENHVEEDTRTKPEPQPRCLAFLARTFGKKSLREEGEVVACPWRVLVPNPRLHPAQHD